MRASLWVGESALLCEHVRMLKHLNVFFPQVDVFSTHRTTGPVHFMWGGRCSVGRVGHGQPKILVGWATMYLAPPIIGLYVRYVRGVVAQW